MSNTSVTADKCGSQSESLVQPREVYSFENDPLPKVRKPYTISKQREKWTEEEHQRFLEALKLYGRGWRQIEEHVGTKTAVQIRSHAQKFFSKVVRESNGGSESFIKPIEIPPPRPKRKPMHPYPRKTVDLLKGTPVSNQPERLPSSNALVLDKDNQSPTSVLSAFASDTSDQRNGCSSPASCTTEMQSANLSPVEKENEYATSNTSPEEEKVPMLLVGSHVENSLSVKIEPESKDSECTKGAAAIVPPYTSIRLLGKTIWVTVSQKPCPQDAENPRSPISKTSQENLVIDNVNFVHTLPSEQPDAPLSFGMVARNCNHPFQSGSPCLEPEKDSTNIAEVNPPNACQPSWPLYQGIPFINFIPYNQSSGPTLRESSVQEGLKEKEVLNERSCAGSSTGSVSELENREKNSDAAVDSQYRQPFSSAQNGPSKSTKGFVPYKRCLPEGDVKLQIIASEERERQRARVCS